MRKYRPLALITLALVWGCDSNETTNSFHSAIEVSTPAASGLLLSEENFEKFLHEVYADLAQVAPGFGGVYLDDNQDPHVVLVNGAPEQSAYVVLSELSAFDPAKRAYATSLALRDCNELAQNLIIEQGVYAYDQLWLNAAVLMGAMGLTTGINGTAYHQGRTGSKSTSVIQQMWRRCSELAVDLGVPSRMLTYEERDAPIEGVSLRDSAPALAGGFQIQATGEGGCTLGFLARNSDLGFVTASHCTSTEAEEGIVTYKNVYQP